MDKFIHSLLNERRIICFGFRNKAGDLLLHLTHALDSALPDSHMHIEIYDFTHDAGKGKQFFTMVVRQGVEVQAYRVSYIPYVNDKAEVNDGMMIQEIAKSI